MLFRQHLVTVQRHRRTRRTSAAAAAPAEYVGHILLPRSLGQGQGHRSK